MSDKDIPASRRRYVRFGAGDKEIRGYKKNQALKSRGFQGLDKSACLERVRFPLSSSCPDVPRWDTRNKTQTNNRGKQLGQIELCSGLSETTTWNNSIPIELGHRCRRYSATPRPLKQVLNWTSQDPFEHCTGFRNGFWLPDC